MNRPAFLNRPEAWTRAARTAQTPADYACAVQRRRQVARTHPAEYVVLAILIGYLVAIIFGS